MQVVMKFLTGTLWQQIGFDVSNTPIAINSADVHGLTSKNKTNRLLMTGTSNKKYIISDKESWFVIQENHYQ